MKFYMLTLGCAKNVVDSEGMERVLLDAGHQPVASAADADALIVNTCGFIDRAKEESIAELRRLAALKRRSRGTGHFAGREPRQGKLLIATGCLSQRYAGQIFKQVPELDGVLGTLRWAEIGTLLSEAAQGERPCWTGERRGEGNGASRLASGPSAYLKIADGCDAQCAFCAIPSIKGPQRSKPEAAIIAEAQALVRQGVKEIVLIAQDTTAYGADRGEMDGLPELLERLVAEAPEAQWYRVMYAYPSHITERLVEVMASHRQIVKYLDIPLQHGHADVLRRMKRPLNGRQVVARLREALPEIALRSAFIVGFPGETEDEFRALLAFMEEAQFDRLGVFIYSPESDTVAAALKPAVPARLSRTRYGRAMELQQRISLSRNRALVGKVLDVLVEGEAGRTGGGLAYGAVGRSYRDAPEVDGLVLLKERVPAGTLVPVRIVDALPYDLVGELDRAPSQTSVGRHT